MKKYANVDAKVEAKVGGKVGTKMGVNWDVLPPFTHLGHMAEIFKPLGVSLGASLESRISPCSSLLRLGSTPNEAMGGRPY